MPRPAPLLAPNPLGDTTSGVPWLPSYTGPRTTIRTIGNAPDPNAEVEKWLQINADLLERALTEQNAFNLQQLQNQREDAAAALKNAMAIARLNNETSRYGTDQQREQQIAELQERQRQFDLNHGLNFAKTATDYLSTPDRFFQAGDFLNMAGQLTQGRGVAPYGAQGGPQAKTWTDFAALAGFGNLPGVQPGGVQASGGGGSPTAGGGGDPRIKAAMGVLKAIPPSDGTGYDGDDFAALSAVESIFRASKPGSYERMRPGQQGMFRSGLSRLGYDPNDAITDMRRSGVGQGSSRQY